MVVAHEFDPLNHDWVARQTRSEPHSTHLETVLELRIQGELYPLESLMESAAFNETLATEAYPVGYPEAGMFVAFLVQRFGLEKMREIMMALEYDATLSTIREEFQRVFGFSIQEAEAQWLAMLDEFLS